MNRKIKISLLIIISAAVLFAAFSITAKTALKVFYPMKYNEFVEKYSDEYGLEPELVYAVIKTESSFDSRAVSSADAIGLTQITPETFEWISGKLGESGEVESLYDPETSIKYGAFLLGYLVDEFENTDVALAAYHAGRGRVNSWLKDKDLSPDGKKLNRIPIPETSHYVKKVNKAINIYTNLY